ncbi:MAG: serine hydrolase domain-containing protein, partial [Rhodothermales bacterium]|nr:serine hydrolase domain-containing protein [Rhodothermales bacterium]
PVLLRTYGLADVDRGEPVGPETNFRLASVTKQFTAIAILMLEARGALSLEEKLVSVFPEMPDYAEPIRIRHLLRHTSGLLDYESLIPDTATVQVVDRDVLAMMLQVDSTYFPPGTQYRYSNTGYAVLAMIVEKRSGKSFPEFLHDNIFEPLGMSNTIALVEGVNTVPHRAYGYTVDDNVIKFSDQSLTSAVLGDGGIYSSLNDLTRWDEALYGEVLVSRQRLKEMMTPHLESYGYGFRIDERNGHKRVHHTGSTSGFRNVIQRFPEDRLTIIVLTNRSAPDVAPLADEVANLFLSELVVFGRSVTWLPPRREGSPQGR